MLRGVFWNPLFWDTIIICTGDIGVRLQDSERTSSCRLQGLLVGLKVRELTDSG